MAVALHDAEWVKIAEKVREYLSADPHTSFTHAVDLACLDIRGTLEQRPADNTVQRSMLALQFIEQLAKQGKYPQALIDGLRSRSASGIGTLRRWAEYDDEMAMIAASRYAAGELGTEPLRVEEHAARVVAPNLSPGRSRNFRVARNVLTWAESLFAETHERAPDDASRGLPANMLLQRRDDPSQIIAIMIFPEFGDIANAKTKQSEFVFAAAGLSLACERVIAVVPRAPLAPESFPAILLRYQVKPLNLDFIKVDGLITDLRFQKIDL